MREVGDMITKHIASWLQLPSTYVIDLVTTVDIKGQNVRSASRHPLELMGERASTFAKQSDVEKKQFVLANIPLILQERIADSRATEALQIIDRMNE